MNRIVSSTIIGIILITLGVFQSKGEYCFPKEKRMFNSYRVSEENKKNYMKKSGEGIIIMGISYIIGISMYQTYNNIIGMIMLIVGFITGIGIRTKAFSKYVKGV